jgi:hypothetical protein
VVYPFWVTLYRLTVCVTLLCNYNTDVQVREGPAPPEEEEPVVIWQLAGTLKRLRGAGAVQSQFAPTRG